MSSNPSSPPHDSEDNSSTRKLEFDSTPLISNPSGVILHSDPTEGDVRPSLDGFSAVNKDLVSESTISDAASVENPPNETVDTVSVAETTNSNVDDFLSLQTEEVPTTYASLPSAPSPNLTKTIEALNVPLPIGQLIPLLSPLLEVATERRPELEDIPSSPTNFAERRHIMSPVTHSILQHVDAETPKNVITLRPSEVEGKLVTERRIIHSGSLLKYTGGFLPGWKKRYVRLIVDVETVVVPKEVAELEAPFTSPLTKAPGADYFVDGTSSRYKGEMQLAEVIRAVYLSYSHKSFDLEAPTTFVHLKHYLARIAGSNNTDPHVIEKLAKNPSLVEGKYLIGIDGEKLDIPQMPIAEFELKKINPDAKGKDYLFKSTTTIEKIINSEGTRNECSDMWIRMINLAISSVGDLYARNFSAV